MNLANQAALLATESPQRGLQCRRDLQSAVSIAPDLTRGGCTATRALQRPSRRSGTARPRRDVSSTLLVCSGHRAAPDHDCDAASHPGAIALRSGPAATDWIPHPQNTERGLQGGGRYGRRKQTATPRENQSTPSPLAAPLPPSPRLAPPALLGTPVGHRCLLGGHPHVT